MTNWNGKIIVIQVTQYFDSFNNIMNEQKNIGSMLCQNMKYIIKIIMIS